MELGFPIPPEVHCTMLREYVLSKGQRREISLKAIAERRNTTSKLSDLVEIYLNQAVLDLKPCRFQL